MEDTIYIVQSESACDCEITTAIEVFTTREKAKDYFDKLVAEEKATDDGLFGYDDTVVDENEDEFDVYREGSFCEDHYCVWILERPLR